jgi:hypothetical protein
MRSMAAVARAAERDAQRRQKLALKREIIANASDAVAQWEDYIEKLSRIHVSNEAPFNWKKIADQPKPPEPKNAATCQDVAQRTLDQFQPSIFDFLWGGTGKRQSKLKNAVAVAQANDMATYEQAKKQYLSDLSEWETDKALAERILKGEPSAYREATEEYLSLSRDEFIGTSLSVSFSEECVHAKPTVHSTDIIPDFQRKQTATGKLSETKMPVSRSNELYQDYVAGAAFKVASDLFRILPIQEVYVTCLVTMLNTQTGYQEVTPILSVCFIRNTLEQMNLGHIDPSDALAKFQHAMQFKRQTGFQRIEPLKPLS